MNSANKRSVPGWSMVRDLGWSVFAWAREYFTREEKKDKYI